jgi:uncharacterized RDD family membrane protein YckC
MDASRGPDGRLHAGFLRRVAASFVDGLVMLAPLLAISLALGRPSPWTPVLQLLAWWAYKAGLEGGPRHATLGKRALGIKVARIDGEPVSFGRASARFFGAVLSAVTLGIGFLMAGFTRRRQALHDMIASCVVVRADATPEEIRLGAGTMPLTLAAWAGAAVGLLLPVLGILAAIAIPIYADYGIRRSMTAAVLAEGAAWQPRAEAAFAEYARGSGTPAAIERKGASGYVRTVVIRNPERRIELNLDASRFRSARIAPDAQIQLVLDASGKWNCRARGVPARYLPPACRS